MTDETELLVNFLAALKALLIPAADERCVVAEFERLDGRLVELKPSGGLEFYFCGKTGNG